MAIRFLFLSKQVVMLLIVFVISGCALISEVNEINQYPRDTAISIGERWYVISTYKCAEVRSIDDEGVLDCYAEDGTKSMPVSPGSQWQMETFKKHFDYEWGSEEHQAYLYDFYYLGGKERLANSILNSINTTVYMYKTSKNLMKSDEYITGSSKSGIPLYGSSHALSGMSIWDAREYSMADWHFNNATYFHLNSGVTYGQGGIYSQRVGNITFHKNGIKSYQFGDTIYHSNHTTTQRITENITYTSDGTHCTKIGNMTRCRK